MTDRATVRTVVYFLGAIALVGLVGLIFLLDRGRPAASVAVVGTIVGGAAGSLGTLLASTRTEPTGDEVRAALAGLEPTPTPVTVKNDELEPIPTADVPARARRS